MAEAGDSKKRLALAIIDFLSTSLKDGTLSSDDTESIEIAQSCIAESFKVDPSDKTAATDAVGSQNLLQIYQVYEKLKGTKAGSASSSSTAGAQASGASSTTQSNPEAESLKGQGNAAMQRKEYTAAIDLYTKALELSPLNPIYLSNRAAAYSATQQHELAANDAEMAVAADPKYTKAWSRLGLAKFALGDAKASMDAYKQGIDAEGNGGSEAMKKGYETAKAKVEAEGGDTSEEGTRSPSTQTPGGGAGGMPGLSSLAGMFGGGGGAGAGAGGGGVPNLSEIMNNPMMRQMAQNLMSNPDMMNNLMNNPRLRDMANTFGGGGQGGEGGEGGGGGMPNLSSLMNDPNVAEFARNMMGGAGRGAPQ